MKDFLYYVVEAAIWIAILIIGMSMILAVFLPFAAVVEFGPYNLFWLFGTCIWWAISGMLLRGLGEILSDNF